METALTGAIDASNQVALPDGFLSIKALWPVGYEATPLAPQSLEFVTAQNSRAGIPTAYAVGQSALTFDGSGDIAGVYFKAVPALVNNGSNWLSVLAYEAYLFGALAEASLDERDSQQAAAYYGRADAVIAELINNDQRDRFNGPLVARKR